MDKDFRVTIPIDARDYMTPKGYVENVRVDAGGKSDVLTFYDPIRLAQDIKGELEAGTPFSVGNLVVVSQVNETKLIEAIEYLLRTGALVLRQDT